MKHSLIIATHPKKKSLTMQMASLYEVASKKLGNHVEVLDLYRCKYQQPFFTFEEASHLKQTKGANKWYNCVS